MTLRATTFPAVPCTGPCAASATGSPHTEGGRLLFNSLQFGAPPLRLESERITGVADLTTFSPWNDFSGSANHATEATNQPTYSNSTGTQNGYPRVLFDGGNDILTLGSLLELAGAFTVCVVAANNSTASADRILGSSSDSSSYLQYHSDTVTRLAIPGAGVAAFTHSGRGTGARVDIWTRDGSGTVQHYMDGTASSGSGTAAGTLALNVIGAGEGGAGLTNFASVNIYAIYVWARFVPATGVGAMWRILQRKYDL